MLHENLHDELSKLDGDFDIICFGLRRDLPDGRKVLNMPEQPADFSDKKDLLYKSLLRFPNMLDNYYIASVVSKCFPMKFIRENNLRFQPQLRKIQDLMFMLEACYAAKKIIYRPILCYIYVINPQSITNKMNFKVLEYCFRTYQAVQKWCDEHSLGWEWRVYIGNTFMSDGLALSYLHKNCKEPLLTTAKVILREYDRFNVGEALKHITFRELVPFEGSGRRVKLFVAKLFGKYIYTFAMIAHAKIKQFLS